MTETIFQDWALSYAHLGLEIIPLKPGSKEPATRHGFKDATSDLERVAEWMVEFPCANIGIVPNQRSGNRGMMFIDIDKHHGGIETMKALVAKHGELPRGPLSVTPHGGFHLPFAFHPGLMQGTNKLGQGIDVKTTSGYLIAPPSRWDGMKGGKEVLKGGGRYRWHRPMIGSNFPVLPGWVIKMLTPPKPKKGVSVIGTMTAMPSLPQIQEILSHIPAEDYETWVKVGMGIKDAIGDGGFHVWDQWSRNSSKYNEVDARITWKSFRRRTGVTFASVVYLARENGADIGRILAGASIG